MRVNHTIDRLGRHVRNPGICLVAVLAFILSFGPLTAGTSVPLKVQPIGTNQVELTLGSLEANAYYQVMVRSNSPDGHWIVFAGLLSTSNSTISSLHDLNGVSGLSLNTLSHWTFVAGRWDDAFGDEFPMIYKELVLRVDPYAPADPYGNPAGDGWNNMQKMQSNMDPYRAYPPHPPKVTVNFMAGTNDPRHGNAVVTWQIFGGPIPDYVLIERATRTFHPATNNWRYPQPPLGVNGRLPTNRPPYFRPPFGPPGSQDRGEWVTGSFTVIGRVPGQAPKNGYAEYRYIDANVDEFAQPGYRIAPHYSPPLRAVLNRVDSSEIRKTVVSVAVKQTTNGYTLTVPHPIPYAWYLLLVRDNSNQTWRASGYFASGTNRESVHLHVDKKGMQHDDQSPVGMPEVRFLPDVIKPEFVAGWGEDSDGDGLPDVYEVLVTHTEPDNADTDNTGILDGYKDMAADGWSNLEKFRRRIDPLRVAHPPATVELKQPTEREIMKAVTSKTDLSCELQIAFRTNGATEYQPVQRVPWLLSKIMNFRGQDERKDFDVRISWQFTEPKPGQHGDDQFDRGALSFQELGSLIQKLGVQQVERFKTDLEGSPPLSRAEMSKKMAEITQAYHQGGLDKGAIMQEMMLLQDDESQDFYGKVVDQFGKAVAGAEVNGKVNTEMGPGTALKTQTDANGLFQFTGIRGRSLEAIPAKVGYQIEGHGLGIKGVNGPDTSATNRAIYTMWMLKGPEPLIHDRKTYTFKPDGSIYTIDLLSRKIVEGTNAAGDLLIQFQRPLQVKPRESFNWSFAMSAIGGGMIEATNDDYLNEAPGTGYQPQYNLDMAPTDPKWHGGEATFYLKSRFGQVYGHIRLRITPVYRDGSTLEIESFINPAGSRNLEFDPSKQVE